MGKILRYTGALFLVLLVGGLLYHSITGEPKLIPRKVIFGNPQKANPQISPDGTTLAYLAPDKENVLNIWVRPKTESGDGKQITSDKKRGIRSYTWQYDNGHLLYVQDSDGDENYHVFQTDLKSKVTRDLTPFLGARSDIVAYDPHYPNTLLVQMNMRDKEHFDVYRVDLSTGAVELDTENPDNATDFTADHNLNVRAIQSMTDDGGILIRVRDDIKSPWRELIKWGPSDGLGGVVGFSPDNQSLWVSSAIGADTERLISIELATGKQTVLASDPTYDVDTAITHPTTHELQAIGVDREKYEWLPIDKTIKKDFDTLARIVGPNFRVASRSLDDNQWIVASIRDDRPTQYYLYDRPKQAAVFLFTTLPSLDQYKLATMKPVQFQSRDGLTLRGYLTLPVGKKPENLPTVLLVHGGPRVRDSWGFNPLVQWLADRGYAVLQVNYRGSSGFGKAFLNAGDREWGNKMHNDLIDAKQWVVQQGIADPQRVAIYGGSYGGYATLVGLTFTPEAFCCGVDVVGPSSLITLLKTIPPYWKPMRAVFDSRVGNVDTEQDFLKSRSPLYRADKIVKPLLIAQGANDPRVKQSESDQIVAEMRKHKLPVEYIVFTDEGHGFVRPENKLKFYAATEHFLSQYIGGRQEAPAPDEEWDDVRN